MPVHLFPNMPGSSRFVLERASVPACLIAAGTGIPALPTDDDGVALVDLLIDGGKLAGIEASEGPSTLADKAVRVDLAGRQVWPMLLDAHAHLDKTQLFSRTRNPDGTFAGARQATMDDRLRYWSRPDLEARMDFALRCAAHHGVSAIRTHLDSYEEQAETSWAAFQSIKEKWRDRIAVQAVALVGVETYGQPFGARLLDLVAEAGGIVGAFLRVPDNETSMPADIDGKLDRLFYEAGRRGLDVDLPVDETGNPASRMLEHVARSVLRTGFSGRVACGHCCSLAVQDKAYVDATLDLCAQANIGIITLPTANLYLQDRRAGTTPRWRGVTLVHEMIEAGLTVAVAGDNSRDPFFAYGDNDMLDTLRQAVRILQLDHPIADTPRLSGPNAAALMGIEQGMLRLGADARLIVFNARTLNEVMSRPQSDRLVLDRGRVIDQPLPGYEELDELLAGTIMA